MKKKCKKLVALSIVLTMTIMLGCQNSDSSVEQPSSDEVVSSEVVEEVQINYATASAEELLEWLKVNPKDMEAIRAYIDAKGYADSVVVDSTKLSIMQNVLVDKELSYVQVYQNEQPYITGPDYGIDCEWSQLENYVAQADEQGRIVSASFASVAGYDCKDIIFEYDENGLLSKITATADIWGTDRKLEIFYENGQMQKKMIDGNLKEQYTYNGNGQLTQRKEYFQSYDYSSVSQYTPWSVTYDAGSAKVKVKLQEYDDFMGEVVGEEERIYVVDANVPMECYNYGAGGYMGTCTARIALEDGGWEERSYDDETENGEITGYDLKRYSAEGKLVAESSAGEEITYYYHNGIIKETTDFAGTVFCDSTENYDSATGRYQYTYQFYEGYEEVHWGWLADVPSGTAAMTLHYTATEAADVQVLHYMSNRIPGIYEKTYYDAQGNIIYIEEYSINAWGENEYYITTTFDKDGNPMQNITYSYVVYSEDGMAARVRDYVFTATQKLDNSFFMDINDKRKEEDVYDITYYFSESIQN
ncbi:MAG: hypothetical protein IJ397_10035 [Lachnospiraceae bacterium]|nr:hypothetical protein [Lachnospiraceae bacterium]